jgi:hypothetical protein
MPESPSLLVVTRGSPILDADRKLLESWAQASERPDELVLIPIGATRVESLAGISFPGLSVEAAGSGGRGAVGFFEVAGKRIEGSRCEWVVLSLGEGRLLPEKLRELRANLALAGEASAVWSSPELPLGEAPTILDLCDLPRAPIAECLAFRRSRLLELGGLEAHHDVHAPWAAFLGLAERGPVRAFRAEVARDEVKDDDMRSIPRGVAALLIQARAIGGSFSVPQQLALMSLAVRHACDPKGHLYNSMHLKLGYEATLERVAKQQPDLLPAPMQKAMRLPIMMPHFRRLRWFLFCVLRGLRR